MEITLDTKVKLNIFDKVINFFNQNNFNLPKDATFLEINSSTLGVVKWEWDYKNCEEFQLNAVSYVNENPNDKIFIFCNHSPLFTLGRGLQKEKGAVLPFLKEFTEKEMQGLTLPLYKIKRGGGLTFHHPGQWIFYPIAKIGGDSWSLSKHFDFLIESTSYVLNSFFQNNFTPKRETAGIWFHEKKVASIGIGVEKFTTIHGIALNLYDNEEVRSNLTKLHPCGLPPQTYTSINDILKNEGKIHNFPNLLSSFHREYIKNLSKFIV